LDLVIIYIVGNGRFFSVCFGLFQKIPSSLQNVLVMQIESCHDKVFLVE